MKDITKKYTKDGVTVVWKPSLCMHSGICFRGLPKVFDPRRKPWVEMDGAARGHDDAFGLEEGPFAIFDPYAVIIDCVTEDGLGQSALCRRQKPTFAQWAWPSPPSPAGLTSASTSTARPANWLYESSQPRRSRPRPSDRRLFH